MKSITLLLVLLFLATHAQAANALGSRVASFTDLPKTDRLIITYRFAQCWGPGTLAEFIYTPTQQGHFEVSAMQQRFNARTKNLKIDRTRLGEIRLETGEANQLDVLIAAYRSPAPSDAIQLTPFFTVEIKQQRGTKVIATEVFSNPPSGPALPAGMLTFEILLEALQKA